MKNSETLRSKKLYKVTLCWLKILPIIMALSYITNVLCAYFSIGLQITTHYIGLVIAPLLFMYLTSYIFLFCNYHRIFIHYIAVVELLNTTDWYFRIPISNKAMCIIHFIITVIFLTTAAIMYYLKYKKKSII